MEAPYRLGLELPSGMSIRDRAKLARWAEENGFQDIWCAETGDPDAFITLAACALATERIRLGTAITPIGTRTVPSIAMATTSLCELAPGRFTVGLGVSSRAMVERWHDMDYEHPLARAREALTLLRLVLAGERTAMEGTSVRSSGFRLQEPPPQPPPIMLAAMSERMLRLAGEIADGVHLNLVPTTAIRTVLAEVDAGASRGNRRRPETILSVACSTATDVDESRGQLRHILAFYLTSPSYQSALGWYGFGEETELATRAWQARDLAAVKAAISDRLLNSVGVFGSPEACRDRLDEYAAMGIDTLCVWPFDRESAATLADMAKWASARD